MTGRRVHERFACDIPVTILADGEEIVCEAKNVSLGGLYLLTELDFPYGTAVKLRFRVPALKEDATVDAVVRWKKPDGIGCQFGSLRALEVWALHQFFKELEPAD